MSELAPQLPLRTVLIFGVLLALSLTGCRDTSPSSSTKTSSSIGGPSAAFVYEGQAANVINKYEAFLRTLHVTRANFQTEGPKQIQAEGTAISEMQALHPPASLASLHQQIIASLQRDKSLSGRFMAAMNGGNRQAALQIAAKIQNGIVEFDRLTNELYKRRSSG